MHLQAKDLAIGYPGHTVGTDIALNVGAGEVLCLLGPNGSGKTTLFRTLLGLLKALGGQVCYDGTPLAQLSRRELARRVAYVPQAHGATFPFLVHDVVLMGRTAHRGPFAAPGAADRAAAEAALVTLGITDLAGRDYTRISGGQRQLVLVARALAQQAPLVVMDEPTASLDFGNQVSVLAQVRRLAAAGLGVVLSTHDPDHAFAVASSVMLLDDGHVVGEGTPQQVLTPDLLRRVYGVGVEIAELGGGQTVCAPDYAARGNGGVT